MDHGLCLTKGSTILTAFIDADWAGCPYDRRSTGSYSVFFGGCPISWASTKQFIVSRSSIGVEYRSLASTTAEVIWICKLLKELHIFLPKKPSIYCDNVRALSLASNHIFHARTKHLEVDYHYVRELILSNHIQVLFVSSIDQIANVFTKGLTGIRFNYLRTKRSVGLASPSA